MPTACKPAQPDVKAASLQVNGRLQGRDLLPRSHLLRCPRVSAAPAEDVGDCCHSKTPLERCPASMCACNLRWLQLGNDVHSLSRALCVKIYLRLRAAGRGCVRGMRNYSSLCSTALPAALTFSSAAPLQPWSSAPGGQESALGHLLKPYKVTSCWGRTQEYPTQLQVSLPLS